MPKNNTSWKLPRQIRKMLLLAMVGAATGLVVLTFALIAGSTVFSGQILACVELPIREKGLHMPQSELLLKDAVALREKGCSLFFLSGFLDRGAGFIIVGVFLSFASVYMFDSWKTATKPFKKEL